MENQLVNQKILHQELNKHHLISLLPFFCIAANLFFALAIIKVNIQVKKMSKLNIKIISDLICPWCYIARIHLGNVLKENEIQANIHWLPYQLNPFIPKEGMERKEYHTTKFGSWAYAQSLDRSVETQAKSLGLKFNYDLVLRTPNTHNGHKLIWLAEQKGIGDVVALRLFSSYFEKGEDIGAVNTLIQIGTASGLEKQEIEAMFASSLGEKEIRALYQYALSQKIKSVPYVVINNRFTFSGAQPEVKIKGILMKAIEAEACVVELRH
jgi:predicted DsbA family dithiol-disulfide isomerase